MRSGHQRWHRIYHPCRRGSTAPECNCILLLLLQLLVSFCLTCLLSQSYCKLGLGAQENLWELLSQVFTGQMHFLLPSQQHQSTEGTCQRHILRCFLLLDTTLQADTQNTTVLFKQDPKKPNTTVKNESK